MHTLIVTIHVASMIASLSLMSGAVGMGYFGNRSAAKIATGGFIATILGFTTGAFLLLNAPLSVQCAELTGYLIGATALYRYGFAFGDASRARFIRQS